jgi:hypothetical protein
MLELKRVGRFGFQFVLSFGRQKELSVWVVALWLRGVKGKRGIPLMYSRKRFW